MLVLAVDQSTTCTGISIFRTSTKKLIYSDAFKPRGNTSDRKSYMVAIEIKRLIEMFRIDILVAEDIWLQPSGMKSNVNTHKVLGALLGMVKMSAMECNIKYEVIPPVTWKSYHGILKGKPTSKVQKAKAMEIVNNRYNIKDLKEDQAEAILIGSFYIDNFKETK
ncbi:MAG: hypothetical protein ACRC6E_02460 [Fusobacteriaceae bacterium]